MQVVPLNYVNNLHVDVNKENYSVSNVQKKSLADMGTDSISFNANNKFNGIQNRRDRLVMANIIIHGAASAAAATSASLAQLPGADEIPLTAITTGMVGSLMKGCYGIPVAGALCGSVAACATGARLGTGCWRHAISWIPGLGNGVSAVTTFTLHETTGWAIVAICEKLLANGQLNSDKKITMNDFRKLSEAKDRLKSEFGKKTNPSFKGNITEERKIINEFKRLINKDDIQQNDSTDFTDLTKKICELYAIKPESNTAKQIHALFTKLRSHLDDNVVNSNQLPIIIADENLIDCSLELHYWLLVSFLNKCYNLHADMDNLFISDKNISTKDIQDMASKLMKSNNL